MDDRLEKALEHGNYRAAVSQRRVDMLERFRRDLVYAENGGLFSATPETIAFISLKTSTNDQFIFIDDRNIPILIKDKKIFLAALQKKYTEATRRYYSSYTELTQARSVAAVMAIE